MSTQVLVEYEPHVAAITALQAKYKNVVYDVATTEGYTGALCESKEFKKLFNQIDKVRVAIKAPALERCKQIDAQAKEFTAPLDARVKELEAMLSIQDEKDRIRVAAIESKIESIKSLPMRLIGTTSEHMIECKQELIETNPNDFAEFNHVADAAIKAALVAIQPMIEDRERTEHTAREQLKAQEAQRLELEKLREQQVAQQAVIDAERAKAAAEQKAAQDAIEAERRAIQAERDALERAERERLHAIQVEEARKQAAADALAKAESDRVEAERRASEAKSKADALRPEAEKFSNWIQAFIDAEPVLNDTNLAARAKSIVTRLAACKAEISAAVAA